MIQIPGQLQPENWKVLEIVCLSILEWKLYNEREWKMYNEKRAALFCSLSCPVGSNDHIAGLGVSVRVVILLVILCT